jgi:hypothetical protein
MVYLAIPNLTSGSKFARELGNSAGFHISSSRDCSVTFAWPFFVNPTCVVWYWNTWHHTISINCNIRHRWCMHQSQRVPKWKSRSINYGMHGSSILVTTFGTMANKWFRHYDLFAKFSITLPIPNVVRQADDFGHTNTFPTIGPFYGFAIHCNGQRV